MDEVIRLFPGLTPRQVEQFSLLEPIYRDWNAKINLVSRKDIDHLFLHHVLHSLVIGRFLSFLPEANVLDLGTGGGFPGIPLAILFPGTRFLLVDSIAKKIRVVHDVVDKLELTNAQALCARAEQVTGTFDFVVSRAVADLSMLDSWVRGKISKTQKHALPNGIICLKGGDMAAELKSFQKRVEVFPVYEFIQDPYFETKSLVYLPSR
jgi:16S rRNA (guanine527-N7)-methyltransferase